ncbi:MAG: NrtR DNA-binding winged helix domain-containing protein [Propionibacteriaceae bacterium]
MGKKNKGDIDGARKEAKRLKKAAKAARRAAEEAVLVAAGVTTPAPSAIGKVAKLTASNPPSDSGSTKKKAAKKKTSPSQDTFSVEIPVVVLAMRNENLVFATINGQLPSTSLRHQEDLSTAATRAITEAGLVASRINLSPLATTLKNQVLHTAWVGLSRPSSDKGALIWVNVNSINSSQQEFVTNAVERLASLLETTTIATNLCPRTFTVGELRDVYRAAWGSDPDGRNFHRKVTTAAGFLISTGERTTRAGGRPATLYRAGNAALLNPALTRG